VTPDGVYENEMARFPRNSASDEEWPAGDPALGAFADDLRVVASGPAPEPRPGLLAAMNQGPTVPIDSPDTTGRKKMLVKTLLGGLAAKVALGAGVAAASVTAAGAAGVLPEPAQHAVASVVAAATPFALPDPSDVTLQADDDPTGSTSTSTSTTSTTVAGGEDDEAGEGGGTAGRTVNHGACVSAAARDKGESTEPGSHGRTVSSIARTDCGKDATGTTSTTVSPSTTTSSTSTTSTTAGDGERGANSGPGSANSGRGNGGNGGNNANNGNGNNGNGGGGSSGRN
jgi:hypothetical protein